MPTSCTSTWKPRRRVEFEESPEGHALRYDARGHLVGVTIANARWLLEQDEQVTITLPKLIQVDRDALAAAIGPRG
jgi:YD repeat-containing protein